MINKAALFISAFILVLTGILFLSKESLVKLLLSKPITSELENPVLIGKISQESGEWKKSFSQPIFLNAPVSYPTMAKGEERVLGVVQAYGGKWIEINLSEQTLYAHEGDNIAYKFLISSGKWGATPKGEFQIWIKLRYATMSGGSKGNGTYYYLPNVPYVMYFYKGYGLHGTYWHNNFGTPMSHGCVNLSTIDAEKLYWWTNPVATEGKMVTHPTKEDPGTKVIIHD